MAPTDSYKWSPELTRKLIRFRAENEEKFLKSRYSAKKQWEIFLKENGLEGIVRPDKASKKWENLKRKYKELKLLKTGWDVKGNMVGGMLKK
uniref:Myb/SANT-like DNA-binding domain-containing protein n=1 Tax=Knipowitschia caucasica TaxID=637954 RepID=A0AAV2MMG0_KNICA